MIPWSFKYSSNSKCILLLGKTFTSLDFNQFFWFSYKFSTFFTFRNFYRSYLPMGGVNLFLQKPIQYMRVVVMSKTTEDFKESLLRFTSSELTSHASNIIGFAIILFAYLNVVSRYFQPVPLKPPFCLSESTLRYIIVFGILWVINTIIIFALGRLAYYGKIATKLIYYDESVDSSAKLWEETTNKVDKIPFKWFSKGISVLSIGFWLSLFVSFVVSFILIWTFLFY